MFEDFCRKNNLNPSRINGIMDSYGNIQEFIDEHNDKFIAESMVKEKGKYPVLHSTYEGLHYSESITEGKLKKLKKQLEGNKMPFDM